jgi:hypothetical protein
MQERVSNEEARGRIAEYTASWGNPDENGECRELLDLLDARKELVEIRNEAWRLIQVLNAYDGSGIPKSDARDAFVFLRRIAARAAGEER